MGFQQGPQAAGGRSQRFVRGGGQGDFEDSESATGGPGTAGQCPPGYVRGIFYFLMTSDTSLCACSLGVVFYKFVFIIFIAHMYLLC
jgi:hypothetical protein